jgi:hypothetical protein
MKDWNKMRPGFSAQNKYFCIALLIGATASCLFRLNILIKDFLVDIPFVDQYFIYEGFVENRSWRDLFFWQHGLHRQGLGGILQKIVLDAFAWDNRAVAYFVAIILFIALAVSIFISRKLFCFPASSLDVALPLIFLTSNQYETLIAGINVAAQALPLLLTIIAAALLFIKRTCYRTPLLALISAVSLFTGFGYHLFFSLAAIIIIDLLVNIRKHDTSATFHHLIILALDGIFLYSFLRALQWNPGVECFQFPHYPLYDYLIFAGLMPAKFFGFSYLRTPVLATLFSIGWVVLALFLMVYLTGKILRSEDPRWRALLMLLFFTASFAALTSVGRVCTGMYAAGSPRYMTLVIPCAFAFYLLLRLIPNRKIRNSIGPIFILLCLGGYLPLHLSQRDSLVKMSALQAQWRSCYLKTQSISECDKQAGGNLCMNSDLQKEVLDFLQKNGLSLFRH